MNAAATTKPGRQTSRHTLDIRVLNCGGMFDLMSEQEAQLLTIGLGLFMNQAQSRRAVPRANVTYCRAYRRSDLFREAFQPAHILHLIGHANGNEFEINGGKTLKAEELARKVGASTLGLPPIVVSTGCKVQSQDWRAAMKAAGAKVLIAADGDPTPTPATLTAFDMAFYSALLSRVWRGEDLLKRVAEAFALSNAYYKSLHAPGTPYAKFKHVVL